MPTKSIHDPEHAASEKLAEGGFMKHISLKILSLDVTVVGRALAILKSSLRPETPKARS